MSRFLRLASPNPQRPPFRREYFDHLSDFASYLLEYALGDKNVLQGQDRMDALVLCAGVFEMTLKHDDTMREVRRAGA
jgi:hypothetical protein